jgi:hypothetical protein
MSVVAEAAPEGPSGIEQSLFTSPVPAGDFSLASADILALHSNPTEQADASAYLSSDFGLYLNPNAISAATSHEISQLQTKMGELAHASRQVEFTGRYTEALPQTRRIVTAKEEAVHHMRQVIADISELTIVNGGELQSQFDGAVKKDLSQQDKYLSTVFFLLSYKKADIHTTRAVVDQTIAQVSEMKPSQVIWNELAEKYDTFIHRLSPPESERTFRQLPPAVRLLAYGHRLGISNNSDEYYFDIADQCDDVAKFDKIVDELRANRRDGISQTRMFELFNSLFKLSFLDWDHGAFRERDDFSRRFEQSIHRRLLFLLRSTEDIGFESSWSIFSAIHALRLRGRGEMGAVPGTIQGETPSLVGEEGILDPRRLALFQEKVEDDIVSQIGHGAM